MATLPPAVTATGTVARPAPPALRRVRRRRRPSGEPPPLPKHLNASGKWWLAASGAVVLACIAVGVTGSVSHFNVVDTRVLQALAALRSPALTRVAEVAGGLATAWVLQGLFLANMLALVVIRRWRHLFVWFGAGIVLSVVAGLLALALQRPRPFEVEILGRWTGFSMPSVPMAITAAFLVNTLYALVPAGRHRTTGKWVTCGLLAVTALSRLYLAQDHPTDIAAAVILGVSLPLAAFRLLTPNDVYPVRYRRGRAAHLDVAGPRGEAIVRALQDQLGLLATSVKPFGLEGSGGSTPLKINVKSDDGDGESAVFGKLYAATHVRSDRWYKLGRALIYGRLEDEQPYHSVRRLVQYEDYVLHLLSGAGLPVAHPLGIVEITPEREYLLVTEFFDGAREIGDAEIDDGVIDQALAVIRRLWDCGLAHRDIKPANLLVKDGHVVLIDVAFAQVRPSPWREAVDLANMMLVLAVRSDADRVYQRAMRWFTPDEVAEAFAATRGVASPTQLRAVMKQDGRDLTAQFRALAPPRRPISLQ